MKSTCRHNKAIKHAGIIQHAHKPAEIHKHKPHPHSPAYFCKSPFSVDQLERESRCLSILSCSLFLVYFRAQKVMSCQRNVLKSVFLTGYLRQCGHLLGLWVNAGRLPKWFRSNSKNKRECQCKGNLKRQWGGTQETSNHIQTATLKSIHCCNVLQFKMLLSATLLFTRGYQTG